MQTKDYIEQLKKIAPRGSLYGIAKILGTNESAVRKYAKGERYFDAYACTKVAELLDVPPMQVIADVEAERETNEARKSYWQEMSKKLVGLSAAAVLSIGALHSTDSPASPLGSNYKNAEDPKFSTEATSHNAGYRAAEARNINYTNAISYLRW